jgi:phage tail-like protein
MLEADYSINGKPPLPYRFLDLLPSLYRDPQECAILHQFLFGLEQVWEPIEEFLDDVSKPYDTRRTRSEFLPWLADWIGIALDHRWDEAKQRRLLRRAVPLYQWRGTRRGITEFLEIYTGITPEITEPIKGTRFGPDALFGRARIGDIPEHCFVVTVFLREDEPSTAETEAAIRRILDQEKPAHTAYKLRLARRHSANLTQATL